MNKKKIAAAILALCVTTLAYAGGTYTNTNQSARFGRYMALQATTDAADGAYYNPAGMTKLKEGFHFSFSNQSAFQKRKINSAFAGYMQSPERVTEKYYEGTASAPIIPSLQGVYRKGKWALSGSIAVVGGGGKATFNDGLSLFEGYVAIAPAMLAAAGVKADRYYIDQYMTGSNFIYGAQIGGSYEINEMFSVYGGFRLNIVSNSYKGYLKNLKYNIGSDGSMHSASDAFDAILNGLSQIPEPSKEELKQMQLAHLLGQAGKESGANLRSKQSGWGISPILGFNFNWKNLNFGAKYEFRTNLNVENKTTIDDTGTFGHGVNTAHDIPALLSLGLEYKFLPCLKASVGYHHFFDRDADMTDGKNKHISGTNEYLFGAEYQIDRMFTVSMGGQITKYGIKDGFQSDLSFSVDSYSLGCGGAVRVSKNVNINIAYFYSDYKDYTKNIVVAEGAPIMKNTYTRSNKVFTAGVDFSF